MLEDRLPRDQAPAPPLSPLPPQPAGAVQLQPCPEQLPSRRRRLLEAGPKVSPSPPLSLQCLSLWGRLSLRPPLEGTVTSVPSCFGDTVHSIEGDRGKTLGREWGSRCTRLHLGVRKAVPGRRGEVGGGGTVRVSPFLPQGPLSGRGPDVREDRGGFGSVTGRAGRAGGGPVALRLAWHSLHPQAPDGGDAEQPAALRGGPVAFRPAAHPLPQPQPAGAAPAGPGAGRRGRCPPQGGGPGHG